MKPQDFVKEYSRLCDAYRLPQKSACRTDCPFINMRCAFPENVNINHPERFEKTYNIVEKWSDTHPVKTRQSEFLKAYPDAKINTDTGAIAIFPCVINKKLTGEHCKKYSQRTDECDACAWDWWTEEIE